jgi:hypothetical protein
MCHLHPSLSMAVDWCYGYCQYDRIDLDSGVAGRVKASPAGVLAAMEVGLRDTPTELIPHHLLVHR